MSDILRIRANRVTTIPQGLCAGPGGTNLRMEVGGELDLEPVRSRQFARYLTLRMRAGDISDVTGKGDASAPAPQPVASSPATAPGATPPVFGGPQ